MGAAMGIYIHIPFCEQKCYYCDFHSIVVADRDEFSAVIDNYLLSLRKEALLHLAQLADARLGTIFIGGGTPTLLPAEKLAEFIEFLRYELPILPEAEITVEANPNSLSRSSLDILGRAGVNRISLGVQAFQDSLLRALGRLHTAGQIRASVEKIKKAGIENVNLDLMFGLPGQTLEQWLDTLKQAVVLGPTHLSCYNLILEEGTPFATWESQGLLELPNDDLQVEMFQGTIELLSAAGFKHYEISNFSRPGYESLHNLHYWHNRSFLGLGSGATGYLNRVRYTNVADVRAYLDNLAQNKLPEARKESVTTEQEMDETMMVGMRLLGGISEADFYERYRVSFLEVYQAEISDLSRRGLVQFKDGHLRVTEQGLFLENLVSGAFLR